MVRAALEARPVSRRIAGQTTSLAVEVGMAKDILLQAPTTRPRRSSTVTGQHDRWIDLHGDHINLFIEEASALGPVLEVTVGHVEEAKRRVAAVAPFLCVYSTRAAGPSWSAGQESVT